MIIINIDEEPIEEKHIAWFTQEEKFPEIRLLEIVESIYHHPDSREYATISRIEIKDKGKRNRFSLNGSHLVLLEAIQKTVNEVEKNYG